MSRNDFHIVPATLADLPGIVDLEMISFPPALQEPESVMRERILVAAGKKTSSAIRRPDTFLVARGAAGPIAYFYTERIPDGMRRSVEAYLPETSLRPASSAGRTGGRRREALSLFSAATHPRERRRGIAAIMTRFLLDEWRARRGHRARALWPVVFLARTPSRYLSLLNKLYGDRLRTILDVPGFASNVDPRISLQVLEVLP